MYKAYIFYLKQLVVKYHGVRSLQLLPLDLLRYFTDISAPSVLPQTILYHAFTMSTDTFADVCIEIHHLLLQQLPLWFDWTYRDILEIIGQENRASY